MLVLAIGDLHIPLRKADLPPKFKARVVWSELERRALDAHTPCPVQALLMPGKIQHVLSPGDLCVKVRLSWCFWRGARRQGLRRGRHCCTGGARLPENHMQRPARHPRRVRRAAIPGHQGEEDPRLSPRAVCSALGNTLLTPAAHPAPFSPGVDHWRVPLRAVPRPPGGALGGPGLAGAAVPPAGRGW